MHNIQGIQGLTGISGSKSIGSIGSVGGAQTNPIANTPSASEVKSFTGFLSEGLNEVNKSMDASSQMTKKLMSGEVQDLHAVTVAGAKSEVMMKLTTTITGKLAQSVSQLFQMQL